MNLNDAEILVMQTMVMRLTQEESLAWLRSHGHDIKVRRFYQLKSKLKAGANKRKFDLQKEGLWEQHMERIDQLETILKFSWENFHRTSDPVQKQKILDSISNIQPLLSAYYSASQTVVERDVEKGIQNTGHISKLPDQ